MGKKGDLLRQAKKQKAMYHFTGEELEAHDRETYRRARLEAWPLMKQKADEYAAQALKDRQGELDAYWKRKHDEFLCDGTGDIILNTMSFALAISCRVLIERFGWLPPNEGRAGRHTKIMRYAQALTDEINEKISADPKMDIVKYAEETRELYNLNFQPETEEENPG